MKIKVKHPSSDGMLYLLEMVVEDKPLVKIGVTKSDGIADRVTSILRSFFTSYRYFCYVRPKRFRHTSDVYKKERILHEKFADRRYETSKQFSGCTELFDVELDEVVAAYEELLKIKDTSSNGTAKQD